MTANDSTWRHWPALTDGGTAKLLRFPCAQGVWGMGPGSGRDSQWLALSDEFGADAQRRARELYAGSEDAPAPAFLWRSDDTICQAVHCYPRRLTDGGDECVLEYRFIEWRNARRLPAALAALALLPRIADLGGGPWGTRRAEAAGQDEGPTLLEPLKINVSDSDYELSERIAEGCRDLNASVSVAALAAMYAQLLAGNRLVPLLEIRAPLTPCAFAVLLLPLERPLADQIAMLSHLPSTRLDLKRFSPGADRAAIAWHLIGCGDSNSGLLPPPADAPTEALQAIGATMAQALLDNDPGFATRERQAAPPQQPFAPRDRSTRENRSPGHPPIPHQSVPPRGEGTREIRIWGAASSGKTAYLAQLYAKLDRGDDPDWSVRLPLGSDLTWFENRREELHTNNRFPPQTAVGANDKILYRLVNKDGRDATIALDDRPGAIFEAFDQETAKLLANADGLLLLLDPMRDRAKQNSEVWRAFEAMHQERRDALQDPRPLAVCVSKCDEYIHTVADFYLARDRPEVFLREHIGKTISDAIAHYFSNPKLFAVSAAGLCITHGVVQPSVFCDENFDLRIRSNGLPMNLLEPLVWILNEIKA